MTLGENPPPPLRWTGRPATRAARPFDATLQRARIRGLDAAALLAENDATRFFEDLEDLVFPGPIRTNIHDCRTILIA